MPSLDGYSLNKKMDDNFERINEQIEILKFRIETEMREIRERFTELSMLQQVQPITKQKKKVVKDKAEA